MSGSSEQVTITVAQGYYLQRPTPEAWGLDSGRFDLRLAGSSSEIEQPVGPADVTVTTTALIAAGSGILTAAITGIFAYLTGTKGGSIKITGRNGSSIEVPEGTSPEQIDFYIAKAKELDAPAIHVQLSASNRKDKQAGRS